MGNRRHWISVRWLLRWTPLIVLLLAAYWRIIGLDDQSLWNDEGSSYSLTQRDIDSLLEAVRADIHPPAYYLLLKAWVSLVGNSEIGLRSLSVFWGIIAVAGTYALGARLYARAAGILAATLVAINPLAVYYSQETRMYAQLEALSVLSLWLFCAWLIPRHSVGATLRSPLRKVAPTKILLLLIGVNTLGLYTQYTYPFTMLVQGILFLGWLMQTKQDKSRFLAIFIGINLITLALFAPWLPDAYRQLTTWPSDDTGASLQQKLSEVVSTITLGDHRFEGDISDYLWIGLLLLTVILPDWYPHPPKHTWRIALPLVWIGAVAGAVMFFGAYREANLKFLLPAQIGVALLIGRGAYLLWDTGSSSAATPLEMIPRYLAVVAFGMILNNGHHWLTFSRHEAIFQRDNYRAIVQTIQANRTPQDAIILNGPGQIDIFNYYLDAPSQVYPLPRGYGGDDAATQQDTLAVIGSHPHIWVVLWGEGERDPHGIVKQTLDTHAFEIRSQWFGNVRLVEYGVLAPPPDQPTTSLDSIHFGDSITLLGYSLQGELTQTGGLIGVTLYWQTDTPLTQRYKVFVQVLNQAGQVVGQHDSEPANGRKMTTNWSAGQTILDNHGVVVQSSLSGEAQIIVGLYPLEAPQNRLRVNGAEYVILEKVTFP